MVDQSNLMLVALSVAIAVFASFVALSMSARIADTPAHSRRWLAAAALTLGGGIWSMHFVGILAVRNPSPAAFDIDLTLVSLLIAIAASALGLAIVSRFGTGLRPLAAGGLLVGVGVASMHYAGMAAMHMPGMAVAYDPLLVGASILVAVIASTAALWLAFRPRGLLHQLAAALIMGVAISGMHYTGMAAAHAELSVHAAPTSVAAIDPQAIAGVVAGLVTLLLSLGLIASHFDRRLSMAATHQAEQLQKSERRYRTLIENASDIIGIVDREGVILYESSSALHILGYPTHEVVGRHFTEFLRPDRRGPAAEFLASVVEGSAPPAVDVVLLHRDGSMRDFELIARNFLDEPTIAGIVWNLRDVTERKQLIGRLLELSETDPLTGAANRRGFLRLAGQAFERRETSGELMQLILFDIDRFKQVNDFYGHAAGDLVLAMVAERCRQQLRPTDLLCRWGGEEFALLLPDADAAAADKVVERIRREMALTAVSTIKGKVTVTASFGMTTILADERNLDAAIRRADEAMYAAKRGGRDCIRKVG